MRVVILLLACGCAGSMRFEGGVRNGIDGEWGFRFGISTGAGIGEAERSEPRPVAKSLGQFVGYVRSGERDTASTTTRYMRVSVRCWSMLHSRWRVMASRCCRRSWCP